MQLMADAVTVLGGRHGLLWDAPGRRVQLIRNGPFDALPEMELCAGVRIGDREWMLPLTPRGERFAFHDQRLTPCTMTLYGLLPRELLKVKLTAITPFRPRDADFSTTPVLGLRLEVARLGGHYRWEWRDFGTRRRGHDLPGAARGGAQGASGGAGRAGAGL
ncbi:MAG: hypothetical protein K9N49_01815 [Candidatus Marinimicrobia bacterium]|nr:hypothetical protein [Candidatus Neomarinimicrobiota bacterium]